VAGFAPAVLVDGVPRQPLPFGLFSVLSPRPEGDARWENGIEWETLTCEPASGRAGAGCTPADDEDPVLGLPLALARNAGDVASAAAFAVYGHHTCSPIGISPALAQERATAHLMAREEARVEQALWTGDLGNTPNLQDDSTDLTGSGAVSPAAALGLLEDFIAANYGSLGVIHITRGSIPILASHFLLTVTGGKLLTTAGTPVVAGAGYPGTSPAGSAATAGTSWAYASPALFGYRSDVFTSSERPGDLLDRSSNDLTAIAERVYVLGYDPCGVGAAAFNIG
jgi:hypothetical protein